MSDNAISSEQMLNNLPEELLWGLFEKTGRIEYYLKYAEKARANKGE